MDFSDLKLYLKDAERQVTEFIINDHKSKRRFEPKLLDEMIMSYIISGGKRLRPAVLMLACGAMGGDEKISIPAAATVEIFHTWTLVHDDVIDSDDKRRGNPTVHIAAKNQALARGLQTDIAAKYGRDIAMLTGDVQHGWCVSILTDPTFRQNVNPDVILQVISMLETDVLCTLVHGEILDVDFGLRDEALLEVSEEDVINMLWMKTGVLYEFSGMVGAMIGQNSADKSDPEIAALAKFCSLCGTAFQLRDDVLGIVGNEHELGKPVGSDIREGKKTTIVLNAYRNATNTQKQFFREILGNPTADDADVQKLSSLLIELEGVKSAYDMSVRYVNQALDSLSIIRPSKQKRLLEKWAYYLIERKF